MVDGAIRLVVRCQCSSSSTKRRAAPLFHVKQASSSSALRLVAAEVDAPLAARHSGGAAAFAAAPHMRHQQRQRRRRHAVDPPGLADGARPMLRSASAGLRSTGPAAPHSRSRPAARSFRRGDTIRCRRSGGRDRPRISRRSRAARRSSARARRAAARFRARSAIADVRIRQQFERRAALAVLVERKAVLLRASFGVSDTRIGKRARRIQRRRFCA